MHTLNEFQFNGFSLLSLRNLGLGFDPFFQLVEFCLYIRLCTLKQHIDLSHMYYVLLPLQPPAFAGSGHALFYEGHIEKQKENFVVCGRNT